VATDIEPQDFDPLRVSPEDPLAAIHYAKIASRTSWRATTAASMRLPRESKTPWTPSKRAGGTGMARASSMRQLPPTSGLPSAFASLRHERHRVRRQRHRDPTGRRSRVAHPKCVAKGHLGGSDPGHKGVGTTFLAYGHDRFTIQRSTTGQARQPMSPSPSPMALVGSTAIRNACTIVQTDPAARKRSSGLEQWNRT